MFNYNLKQAALSGKIGIQVIMKNELVTGRHVNESTKPAFFWSNFYTHSLRILAYLCGQIWFQKLTRKRRTEIGLLNLFFKETNYPESFRPATIRKSIMTDLLTGKFWGEKLIGLAPMIVEGREHVELAQAAGRSVILARFHQKLGLVRLSSPLSHWLNQQEFKPALSIGGRRIMKPQFSEKFSNTQDLFEAYKILKKGGVVQIVPDGFYGERAISTRFHHRNRHFRTGFAELALATQASIIPICLQFREDGVVVIKISAPLHVLNSGTQDEKIADLISQYVAGLNDFWASQTHLITYIQMRKHLESPARETSASSHMHPLWRLVRKIAKTPRDFIRRI